MKDEPLLRALVETVGPVEGWVLVTGDDAMPDDHGIVIAELQISVATQRSQSQPELHVCVPRVPQPLTVQERTSPARH